MRLSARQLNRATLGRQMLLQREPLDVVDAVRRVVAIQAQQAASPYLALWNRVAPFDAASLDSAFAEHAVVKASLMRITLHAVHTDDYPAFHNAMVNSLRASRLGDPRFQVSGLSIVEADALVPHLLGALTRPHTGAQIEELLGAHVGDGRKPAWWAMRTFAPLMHAPTGGPWSFGTRSSFVAARSRSGPQDTNESVQRLFRRYLEGFGPASVADFAQFTLLRRPVIRAAIDALAGELVALEGPDGSEMFDVPGALLPTEDTPAPPRLMAMWESTLLAYADRSRVIPEPYRRVVIRQNGDVLPTLLVDGSVAGVWRAVPGGIEATAFHRLTDDAWMGLAAEAQALLAFLADREPAVYRRYAHWWPTLPNAEVRLLPG